MIINKIENDSGRVRVDSPTCKELVSKLRGLLDDIMFDGGIESTGKMYCSVNMREIRLSSTHVEKCGSNVSPYMESYGKIHRRNVLGWRNWLDLANGINDILDGMNLKAEVSSMHRGIVLRTVEHGRVSENELDRRYGGENIGSEMYPVYRRNAWHPEDEEKAEDCRKKAKPGR
jgi:hypothetical protein